jgi:phosphoribosyl 1,2-cyclic phosphate phosphodiesterase
LIFCNCRVCKNARTSRGKDIRKRSSLLVNDDLLIDLGPDITTSAAMYNIDLTKIKYILQTHGHADHFDAGHLVTRLKEYASEDVGNISLFASKETVCTLNMWLKTEEPEADLFDLNWLNRLCMDIKYLRHGNCTKIGDYLITSLESFHDIKDNSLMYIITYNHKNVMYGTDLLEISGKVWEILKSFKLDLVILDHTYGKGRNAGGHFDSGQVIDTISKMKAERIIDESSLVYATHISHEGNDIHEVMEKAAANNGYHIAYDGLEITI